MKKIFSSKDTLKWAFIASLTLGLAPFTPEPHIWKQLLNIAYDRKMLPIDWFDLLMHGAPWILFIVSGIFVLINRNESN